MVRVTLATMAEASPAINLRHHGQVKLSTDLLRAL